jgi:hypothetical protein
MAKRFFYVCAGLLMLTLAYQLGASVALGGVQGVIPTETALASGPCDNGTELPLPTYRDGTTALESECTFMVIPRQVSSATSSFNRFYAVGRTVHIEWDGQPWGPGIGASYVVIATRGVSGPTATSTQSWGAVKARYR